MDFVSSFQKHARHAFIPSLQLTPHFSSLHYFAIFHRKLSHAAKSKKSTQEQTTPPMTSGHGPAPEPPLPEPIRGTSSHSSPSDAQLALPTETTPLLSSPSPFASPENEEEDEEEEATLLPPTPALAPGRLYLTLGAAYVGVFLGAVDASIMATLSGPMASELASLSLLSWLAAAYLIANAACQPLSGRLTDVFGRGPGLVFSNAAFGLGNLLCGLATDGAGLILGRVVAGVGGGGLMSISTFLASDLVPLKKRGVVQGVGNIAYG